MSTSTVKKVYFRSYGTFIEILLNHNDPELDSVKWIHVYEGQYSHLDGMFIDVEELAWLPNYSQEEMFQLSLVFEHEVCVYLLREIQEYFGELVSNGVDFTNENEVECVELTVEY